MKHEPYLKLKGKIREKGMTYDDVADEIGLTHTALCNKINGRSDFYISEAVAIAKMLTSDMSIFMP